MYTPSARICVCTFSTYMCTPFSGWQDMLGGKDRRRMGGGGGRAARIGRGRRGASREGEWPMDKGGSTPRMLTILASNDTMGGWGWAMGNIRDLWTRAWGGDQGLRKYLNRLWWWGSWWFHARGFHRRQPSSSTRCHCSYASDRDEMTGTRVRSW